MMFQKMSLFLCTTVMTNDSRACAVCTLNLPLTGYCYEKFEPTSLHQIQRNLSECVKRERIVTKMERNPIFLTYVNGYELREKSIKVSVILI